MIRHQTTFKGRQSSLRRRDTIEDNNEDEEDEEKQYDRYKQNTASHVKTINLIN